MINNRQVNIWRGTDPPPTNYHVWLDNSDNKIKIYDDETQGWVSISSGEDMDLETPPVVENPDDNAIIGEDDAGLYLLIDGNKIYLYSSGLSVQVYPELNAIKFTSNAITTINTTGPIKYEGGILSLDEYDIKENQEYGSTGDYEVLIPVFNVNKYGSVTNIRNSSSVFVNLVKQESVSLKESNKEYPILSSYTPDERTETNSVIKIGGLTYNPSTDTLTISGKLNVVGQLTASGNIVGNVEGDITGNVTGTAVPKVHLSNKGVYGGASKALLGHVRLLDEFEKDSLGGIIAPVSSSDNSSDTNDNVDAVAASPLMVYNALQESKKYTDSVVSEIKVSGGGVVVNANNSEGKSISVSNLNFGSDFVYNENNGVLAIDKDICSVNDKNGKDVSLKNIKFSQDFVYAADGGILISWYNI